MTEPVDLVRHLIDKLINCYEARLNEREQLGRLWAGVSAPVLPEVCEPPPVGPTGFGGSIMSRQGAGSVPLGVLNGEQPVPAAPEPGIRGPLVFRLLMTDAETWEPHHFVDCKGPIIGCRPVRSDTAILSWVQVEQVHPDDREAVLAAMAVHSGSKQYEFASEHKPADEQEIPF